MTARVALVTGAGRGIGAATVRTLAEQGYAVVALDWCAGGSHLDAVPYAMPTREDLERVVAGLPNVVAHVADVQDEKSLGSAVAEVLDRWGRLDVVVAAAAVMLGGDPVWETPRANVEALWNIDVMGVWNTAAATIPVMLSGPDPSACRFVAVASAAGTRGLYHLGAYGMVKHAVVGLVKGLAADLVGTGVTAVAVSPGSTRTPMAAASAAIYGMEARDLAQHQLLKRLLEPSEIAATIAFCASPEGGVLNGSVVHADGGFHA
jgi:SDR family mycofactocin-dependent oxidoreductase